MQNAVLTTMPKKFQPKTELNSVKIRKKTFRLSVFTEKNFVKFSRQNPESFLSNTEIQPMNLHFFRKKIQIQKCSFRHVESNSEKPAKKLWHKVLNSSAQLLKVFLKFLSIKRSLKKFLWMYRMQFSPLRKCFTQTAEMFSLKDRKNHKISFFPKRYFFPKMFVWTRKMHIWHHCWIFFAKKPWKIFGRNSRIFTENPFSIKHFSSKHSSWHVECGFEHHTAKTSSKFRNLFSQSAKVIRERIIFRKKLWYPQIFLGHVDCSFHNTAEKFAV